MLVWHEVLGLVRGGKRRVYWKTRKEVRRSVRCASDATGRVRGSWTVFAKKKYIYLKSQLREHFFLCAIYFREKLVFYEMFNVFLLPLQIQSERKTFTCNCVTTCSSLPPFWRDFLMSVYHLGLLPGRYLSNESLRFLVCSKMNWGWHLLSNSPSMRPTRTRIHSLRTAEETDSQCVVQLNGKLTTRKFILFYVRDEPSSLNYNSIGC